MEISLKAFINLLTLFSMGVLCLPKVFPRRLISGGVNSGLLFMKNCFPYCFLEIIDKISRVATNLENMENSGNLKNCQNLRENLEKTQGNLNF